MRYGWVFAVPLLLTGCDMLNSEISCGPDGIKIRGGSVRGDTAFYELCREALHQPRPLTIDQNSVVCWKKGPDGWQWEQCARNELSERQKEIFKEIHKQTGKKP